MIKEKFAFKMSVQIQTKTQVDVKHVAQIILIL